MAEQLSLPAIESRLCAEIMTIMSLKGESVTPDVELRALGMDSLRFVSLLIAVEKAFGVNLLKSGLKRESLQSVRTLATAVHAAIHK